MKGRILVLATIAALAAAFTAPAQAAPSLADPSLRLSTAVSGLNLPTSLAFIGPNDMLVLEKDTGRVLRVTNGSVQGVALDLSVNNFSERGLLGIALHPNFPTIPHVFLFWTCRSAIAQDADPFTPEETACSDANMTGLPDSSDVLQVPLLGNRVDRFVWNGSTLTHDRRLITLLAFQNDGAPTPPGQGDDASGPHGQQPARGNHDGGVLAFGPDRKLYVFFGDAGRRGQLQNLPFGPTPPTPDDQFGGPEPDDAHFAGVILRLNDDGSAPTDNPFFGVGGNLQKVYAYGVRNGFGMAFDPLSGNLWDQENGEDAFDEVNLVERGMNSGWIQITGPLSRIGEFKQIETTSLHHEDFPNLQQFRWGPEKIADTPQQALSRMSTLSGSRYSDPEFSWKYVLAPAGIGFVSGRGLGPQFEGDLLMGFSTLDTLNGPLFRFNLTGNRRKIGVDDPRLEDRVADNLTFHEMTESESLVLGTDFGIVTDIKTGPDGRVYVVSLSDGAIYQISGRR
jgi:glucose/arabinose dehydrogenase